MIIDILTIFPDFYQNFKETSIIKRAIRDEKVIINTHDLRDFAHNKHRQIDDTPYGGGVGMLMQFPPIYDAIESIKKEDTKIILVSPQGQVFNQTKANELAQAKHLVFISGHYEGIDARVEYLIDEEISIGDVVLTNGDIPVMVIADAIVRLIKDVIMEDSVKLDSLYDGLLKYPQFTKPENYKGYEVPKILLSGHHKNIDIWRKEKQMEVTLKKRPDLINK
jgi:tRNA (guanine37-N1)-methyltransferase